MNGRWVMPVGLLGFIAVMVALESPAQAIPAFARKTGMRCTSCHESWPVLSDFGRAFRDNGYQVRLGKDDPTTTPTGYWPVAIRTTPHYEYNTVDHQDTDDGLKTLSSGGVADGSMDILSAGTLGPNASFLVVPTGFEANGAVTLESYWIYLSRAVFHSDWLNVRFGKHEVDLPASSHRPINMTNGYLVYAYHSAAEVNIAAPYDMGGNQRGLEMVGHDLGSLTRYSVSVFDANDSPGSRNAWDSPSIYGHVQKYWRRDSDAMPQFELGAFGAQASYPTTTLTESGAPIAGQGGSVKASSRYGGEAQLWLGPSAAPLHLNFVYATGKDDKRLFTSPADRDGRWNGGFLEAIWVPPTDLLHWGVFGRVDMIRNADQPFASTPDEAGDQDQLTGGVKYTLSYNNRAEYALHAEYSTNRTKKAASDGSDVRASTVFVGIDFAY